MLVDFPHRRPGERINVDNDYWRYVRAHHKAMTLSGRGVLEVLLKRAKAGLFDLPSSEALGQRLCFTPRTIDKAVKQLVSLGVIALKIR